ncbi:hypothetical protein [Thermotalea metallivorans]|uniref:Uncharacterized protein n=1 Tax=Thermotalea metallivorans TaxID=520762 RepID=A0A140LA00_9FIRM|nr:hypothetical protein [Thermotalea metallivorans]KXG77375.1 hypothetical protein AN619_05010 [Thermotalea metallivorans]
MYEELLELVKGNKIKYHIYMDDLLINVDVSRVEIECNSIKLFIPGGEITIWDSNKIVKCRRPDNLIIQCSHCFRIYNQYGDNIGFVYC